MNSTPNEHDWFNEQIGAYLAGALDADERVRFEAHAAGCEPCRAELDATRQMENQMTAALAGITPAADFEDQIVQRLRMNLTHRRWIHPAVKRVAATAAAAVVVASVGFVGQAFLKTGRLPDRARMAANLRALGQGDLQNANENRDAYPRARYGPSTQPGGNDVNATLGRLVRTQEVVGEVYTAPASNAERWDFGGGANTALNWSDFNGRANGTDGLNDSHATPYPESNALPGLRLGDANNHDRDFKNVLYDDGYLAFQSRPLPGIDQERIYSRGEHANTDERGEFRRNPVGEPQLHPNTVADENALKSRHDATHQYFAVTGLNKALEATPEAAPAPVGGKDQKPVQAGVEIAQRAPVMDGKVQLGRALAPLDGKHDVQPGTSVALAAGDPVADSPRLPDAAATQSANAAAPVIRRVIREGVIEFEVDSFDSAFNTIAKITAEEGGFIAAADSDRLDNGKVRGVVTVRVPPDRLDVLILKLRALGDLKSQRLGSKDISKQYTDLESELRACRAMEERLLEMIRTSKGKVAELLEAEKELGNQRTKIEKIQGELNYYNNLVSMATLTITASEKDIRTPASASQTEEINTGVETDDVEHARSAIIQSIDEAKGRIIESELKQLEAGQLAARVVADVAPEHAGPLVDRLKQLGRVARLDIQRKQTETKSPSGAPIAPQKIEQAPTRLIISMYNLANVAPRLTTNLTLGAEDVEATYRRILKRVRDADGRVLSSNLNRQDATQVNGNVQFEVKSADADAVLNDIRTGPGAAALTVNMTENPDTANVTTAKQAFTVQIIPAGRVAPREIRVLAVQSSDVEGAMQKVIATAGNLKGRVIESSISQDANGKQLARIAIELPLGSVDQMVDFARQQGKVRTAEASKNSQVPDGPLARARIMLSIGSGETIVPGETGFWASIRDGLSTSVRGLLWSVQVLVVGLCLVGPWVLIAWGGLRFWRRKRAAT